MAKKKPIDVEQYKELISKGKLVDPLIFLESLVNGTDLRNTSQVYDLVIEIDEMTDGEPTPDDWEEVVNMVRWNYKQEKVKIAVSQRAAEKLAEYIHPKVKPDEANNGTGVATRLEPLTEDDIDIFKEKFNEEF